MSVSVRLPGEGDFPAWRSLRRELWPECSDEEHEVQMETVLADADRAACFLAAPAGGAPVGFLEVALRYWSEGCVTTPVGYLEGWYVRPQHRRQGIGSALLAAAEGWARQRSALEMASDTELADADSRRLHREMGYQEVAERVHLRKHLGAIPPGEGVEGGGDGGDRG